MEERLPKGTLGGQAVIEGVMMKGPESYSVAIRKPDQKIEVKLNKFQSYGDKHKFCKVPFIRGIVNFVESMVVGMQTLTYSSSFYEEEEEETKADKVFKEVFKEKAESVTIGLTVVLSIIIAVALFMMLPAGLAEFLGRWVKSHVLLAIIEGIIRLAIFIIYVLLISQMEDIKRVFMYHGAEHKTINCYESGDELTPENVAKHSRYHKRCGTSFLFVVMVISIFVFMFITAEQMWLRFLLRLLLVPVVAGISYEFIRLAGRNDNAFFDLLSKPGMWIQKITTKEPNEEMIQVAIISVEAVLYGKAYVKAVNEAQGIGVEENVEETDDSYSTSISDEELEFENVVLGEELEDTSEYEEEYEEVYEEYEEYEDEEIAADEGVSFGETPVMYAEELYEEIEVDENAFGEEEVESEEEASYEAKTIENDAKASYEMESEINAEDPISKEESNVTDVAEDSNEKKAEKTDAKDKRSSKKTETKDTTVANNTKENDKDEIEDIDISEFEKSFFED